MNTILLEIIPSPEHQLSYQQEQKQVDSTNFWGCDHNSCHIVHDPETGIAVYLAKLDIIC